MQPVHYGLKTGIICLEGYSKTLISRAGHFGLNHVSIILKAESRA
jgi:hypothetical protein